MQSENRARSPEKPGTESSPEKPGRGPEKPDYVPSEREEAVLKKQRARRAGQLQVRVKIEQHGSSRSVAVDHPDESVGFHVLMDAVGTADPIFADELLRQLARASAEQDGKIDESALNFMLSVIKGINPRDQLESMLAAQMAAVHAAAMRSAARLDRVKYVDEQEIAERAFNKLTRTFTTQMEALKRYRTGGEQKVTVQHVSVSEGGQAIVGNVTQAAPAAPPAAARTPRPALTVSKEETMPLIDEAEHAARTPASVRTRRGRRK